MASTIKQIIQVINPDLYADAGLDVYIELAEYRTDKPFFGSNYNHAVALRAAHNYAIAQRGTSGGVGSVSSKKEGDLQVSFSGSSGSSSSGLGSTQYGQDLLQLIREGQPGVSVTGDQTENGLSTDI